MKRKLPFPVVVRTYLTAIWILLVVFPKAGFYSRTYPVYALYIAMATGVLPLTLWRTVIVPRVTKYEFAYWVAICPLWFVWGLGVIGNGYVATGALLGHVFSVYIAPIYFLTFAALIRAYGVLGGGSRVLVWTVRIVAVFGLLSFGAATALGDYINVPYVTSAGGDVPLEVWQKNNMRGDLFKLVSTYGNGNIYGVCLAMLAPLYWRLERRRIFSVLVVLSLVCTLSRTVWVALVFILLCYIARSMASARTVRSLGGLLGLVVVIAALLMTSTVLGGKEFLLDGSLGDRSKHLWMLKDLTWLPGKPVDLFAEIPYLSAAYQFGITGLVAFCVFFVAPAAIGCSASMTKSTGDVAFAMNVGLGSYILSSLSDAAFLYVPTFAMYMFLFGLRISCAEERFWTSR